MTRRSSLVVPFSTCVTLLALPAAGGTALAQAPPPGAGGVGRTVSPTVTMAPNAPPLPKGVGPLPMTPEGLFLYTVKKGDTCQGIARTFYKDPRRVDLIHNANPRMGPPPHSLREGNMLRLPPSVPAVVPTGEPDARLAFLRNQVDVFVPAERKGQVNDPLYRGNRVNTHEASAANLLFRDETELRLDENTLVVVLGDINAHVAKAPQPAETTLVSGSLRSHLAALAGRPTERPLTTPAATVVLGTGESRVHVDEKRTTRLAVYDGRSKLSAQKKTVDVDKGFGSKAEEGKAPTEPKPLPPAPSWSAPPVGVAFVSAAAASGDPSVASPDGTTSSEGATSSFAYRSGGSAPAQWHLQLSRDDAFQDLAVNAKVPAATNTMEAQRLPAGLYRVRVSAVDDDAFEGPFGPVATLAVVAYTRNERPDGTTEIRFEGQSLRCAVDSGPMVPVGTAVVVPRGKRHVLSCLRQELESPLGQPGAAPRAAEPATPGRLVVDREPLVVARVESTWVSQAPGTGDIRVRLTDAKGRPVVDPSLTAVSSTPAIQVGRMEEAAFDPGLYFTRVHWQGPEATFRLRVPGASGLVDGPEMTITAAGPASRGGDGTGGAFLEGLGGIAVLESGNVIPRAQLGVGYGIPAGPGEVFFGLRAGGALGDKHQDVEVGAPLGFRFGPRGSTFVPYGALVPGVLFQFAEAGATSSRTAVFAPGALLGAGLHAGPGAVFLEGGYRLVVSPPPAASYVPLEGATFSLGYRLHFGE